MVGRTIAQYDILARVGGGGMGVVYRAKDAKLGRTVALKFLPQQWSHDDTAKQRFVREAQAASATNHPNICTIHDIETADDGQLFIVMAYYEGQTLKQRLEQGPLSVDEALEIATQIADGLAKAHAQGVVHRDIKPGNVMLTEDGVRILDFGLATFADALKLTIEHSTLGTVAYMSPEQVQGRAADARSDVWAAGVVLYEMLAGHAPFQGSHAEAISYAIRNETPAPLRSARAGIPEEVEQLVLRALHKEPSVRYQSGRELARALRLVRGQSLPIDLLTQELTISRDVTQQEERRRRHPTRWVGAAAAVLLATGIASWYVWFSPVERIPVAVAPVFNETGRKELEPYRLALTSALVMELSGSPNIRVPPYGRLLQIIRRFIVTGADVSNPEAVQAVAKHTGARFVVRPVLIYEGGRWRARADIQDALTSTSAASVETESLSSAIAEETAHTLIAQLAARLEEHFKANGPGKSYVPRTASARLRSVDALKAFEEGLNAFDQLEYAAAEQSFLKARELDSRNPLLLAWLSRVEQVLRKPDDASAAAESAVPLLTDQIPPVDTLFVGAVVAEARRDFAGTEREYRNLIRRYPDEAQWSMALGGFQERRDQTEAAVVSYHRALGLDARLPRPDVELCRLYNLSNDSTNARKHARDAVTKYVELGDDGGQAQALFCLTEVLRAGTAEEKGEARRYADTALSLVEKLGLGYSLSWAHHYVGLSKAEEGDLKGAVDLWEKSASEAKTSGNRDLEPRVQMNLGVAHARLGNRQRAMEYYQLSAVAHRASGNQLRAARAQVNRAQLRVDFGDDPDQAVEDARNALQVFVDLGDRDFEVFSRQTIGGYDRYLARYKDAEQELHRALQIAKANNLKGKTVGVTVDLARSYFDRNDYREALSYLETVGDEFDQDSLHAWIRLARTYLRLGNSTKARDLLSKAEDDVAKRTETEYRPLLYATLGELEYESGRLGQARTQFSRAAERWTDDLPDPASVEARAYVGLIDALQGRVDQGLALIESSLTQAVRMRQVALEVRCRVFLARVLLVQRRPDEALERLSAITWDGPGAVGPELLAQARYWRGRALSARGDSSAADVERQKARDLLDELIATLAADDKQRFTRRPDIRAILG
jgi:tetratricopeptide (TPR) repeat protein